MGGGATSFSQEPLIVRGLRFSGFRIGDVKMEDPLFQLGYKDYNPVSVDTDNVAAEYGISRLEQDEWALRSHQNYGKAWKEGKFKDEIIPLEIPQKGKESFVLDIDEQYREDTTLEKLSKLKPIYGCKAVTAGNAPGLNDGATAILLMTRKKAERASFRAHRDDCGDDLHCHSPEPDARRPWGSHPEGIGYGQDQVRSN